MKRNLLNDLDSSDEEESTISIELVNKIIYDYFVQVLKKILNFSKLGYENTGNCLMKESPVENPKSIYIQKIIENFSFRVKV
jgi:hypothetical protein